MRHPNDSHSPADLVALTKDADRLDRDWDHLTMPLNGDTSDAALDPDQVDTLGCLHALGRSNDNSGARERVRRRVFAIKDKEDVAMIYRVATPTLTDLSPRVGDWNRRTTSAHAHPLTSLPARGMEGAQGKVVNMEDGARVELVTKGIGPRCGGYRRRSNTSHRSY